MNEHVRYILALSMPDGVEWLVILAIALLIWGKRLPEVARSLGRSMAEFKKGARELDDTKDEVTEDVKKLKDDVVKQTKDAAGLHGSN